MEFSVLLEHHLSKKRPKSKDCSTTTKEVIESFYLPSNNIHCKEHKATKTSYRTNLMHEPSNLLSSVEINQPLLYNYIYQFPQRRILCTRLRKTEKARTFRICRMYSAPFTGYGQEGIKSNSPSGTLFYQPLDIVVLLKGYYLNRTIA